MDAIRTMLRRLRADQSGATAIEYGLIAALIAVACISGFSALGGGAGAAERDEREIARIESALNRDEPQRAEHIFVHDVYNSLRGFLD